MPLQKNRLLFLIVTREVQHHLPHQAVAEDGKQHAVFGLYVLHRLGVNSLDVFEGGDLVLFDLQDDIA